MSTIEQDVERVRAVHAVLSTQPVTVWSATWRNRHGDGVELFFSERGAREQLLVWLESEKDDLGWSGEDYESTLGAITDGTCNDFDDESDRWYAIAPALVRP